ncbi:MAG: 2-amino-3,7-dideoxy-D-threo-hept-6-ulosonate synthase [bacterium]
MNPGKMIRMERIWNRNTGRTVIVPMDHGVTSGPIQGLIKLDETINRVAEGGANAIVEHSGMVRVGHRRYGKDIGLIVHLSGSTSLGPDPNHKVLVCSVEKAIQLGADAVSIHINLGAEDEPEMLRDFGRVAEKCYSWGMPLLAMVYPRGKKVPSEKDPRAVAMAARLAAELGADIVKVPYTGSVETFRPVVEGSPIPVVIAGGSKQGEEETLRMVEEVVRAGAAGLSMGRNAFQHETPERFVRAACMIVHEGATAEDALRFLRSGGK